MSADPEVETESDPWATAWDVAVAAGVSPQTVREVVSRRVSVHDPSHRRALAAAMQLRYPDLPISLHAVMRQTAAIAAAARVDSEVVVRVLGWADIGRN